MFLSLPDDVYLVGKEEKPNEPKNLQETNILVLPGIFHYSFSPPVSA